MKKVLVLMGGMSSEREISLLSGTNVANALTNVGYHIVAHDLTTNINALITLLQTEKPDVVFNALHGKYGEDGCIQGLLNMLKIPYTHSGVLASSVGMNKEMTRQIVSKNGVSVPNGKLMTKADFLAHEPIKPYVIKPNYEGSTVGVFIVISDNKINKGVILYYCKHRNALDAEHSCYIGVGIYVYSAELYARILFLKLCQYRCNHLARSAPLGIQIKQDSTA